MPTHIRPPIPSRPFSGIPYGRMIHEELTEAMRRVIKGVLLGAEVAGSLFPDDRVVEIVVRLDDEGVVLPTWVWAELRHRGADRVKLLLQNRNFDSLEVTEKRVSFALVFDQKGFDSAIGETHEAVWGIVRIPWEALIFWYDHRAGVVLEIPEPLKEEPTEQDQEAASQLARKLAAEAFQVMDDDEEPRG